MEGTPTDAVATVVQSAQATQILSPQQAMQLLEARRAWVYAVGLASLSVFGAGLVLYLGGDPLAGRLHIAALALTAIAATIYAIVRRDRTRYRENDLFAVAVVSVAANITGYFYWGTYSAYLGVVAVSGYAFASGSSKWKLVALSIPIFGLHLALGVGQLTGLVAQHGFVIVAPSASGAAQVVFLVVIQVVMIMAVAGGLDTKKQMKRVLDEHHAAIRQLSQREAQLAEARAEVREARAPGEGRFTGQQLGKFRLGIVLGRGAMGEVYAAEEDGGGVCAVKVLAQHLLGDQDSLKRFQREAGVIASLHAPNIVRMLDVSAPGAAQPYFAMERLDGKDLGDLIKERPVRELGEVVTIVREIAAGLDAAHEAGVVHRDLKPANVFAARGLDHASVIWKVLDFGVSKLFAAEATQTAGHIVGTPGYMAPEQARGELVDRRADIYSLGVIAYRVLTGRPAIMPGEPAAMLHEVVFFVPPQPSQIAAVSAPVEAVLAIALAKLPDDRFATAGELAAAFADAARNVISPAIAERAASIVRRAPGGTWIHGGRRPRADTRLTTTRDLPGT